MTHDKTSIPDPFMRKDPFYTNVFIPKLDTDISPEYIREKLGKIGHIINLTEVVLRSNPNYKRVFFKIRWNPVAKSIDTQIRENGYVNLVYDELSFWKLTIIKD